MSRTTRQQYDWDAADAAREREKRLEMEAEKDKEIKRLEKRLEEDEKEPDFHQRTLGRSCMYGSDGSVIYRPSGARCKGDPPAARSRSANQPKSRSRAAPRTSNGPQKGRCLYGAANVVIYAPPGVNCAR